MEKMCQRHCQPMSRVWKSSPALSLPWRNLMLISCVKPLWMMRWNYMIISSWRTMALMWRAERPRTILLGWILHISLPAQSSSRSHLERSLRGTFEPLRWSYFCGWKIFESLERITLLDRGRVESTMPLMSLGSFAWHVRMSCVSSWPFLSFSKLNGLERRKQRFVAQA